MVLVNSRRRVLWDVTGQGSPAEILANFRERQASHVCVCDVKRMVNAALWLREYGITRSSRKAEWDEDCKAWERMVLEKTDDRHKPAVNKKIQARAKGQRGRGADGQR